MCRSMWSYVVSEPQVAECNWVHGVAPRCDWTPSARLHIWVLLSLFHRGESGAARAGSIVLKAREQRFAVATLAFNSRASSISL
jgi:hypothetical protein